MCYWISIVIAVLSAVSAVALLPLSFYPKHYPIVTIIDIALFVFDVFPLVLQPDADVEELAGHSVKAYIVCSAISLVLLMLGVICSIALVTQTPNQTEELPNPAANGNNPSEKSSLVNQPQSDSTETPGGASSDQPDHVPESAQPQASAENVQNVPSTQNADLPPEYSVYPV